MQKRLDKRFFSRPALDSATDFLGKVLVHETPQGRLAGIVYDVEAYPAFLDQVHHGNKKTLRTRIMWGPGGHAYVYVIYGVWHQFAAVVNKENIPDVVFIRAALPVEGVEIMQQQWDVKKPKLDLSSSPGKLCKSFLITKEQYGTDLTGDELFFEDWNIKIPENAIQMGKRIGIASVHEGFDRPLRFFVRPRTISL